MAAEDTRRYVVEVRPRGLPWWGEYGRYTVRDDARRVEARLRERGWYGKSRVIDERDFSLDVPLR